MGFLGFHCPRKGAERHGILMDRSFVRNSGYGGQRRCDRDFKKKGHPEFRMPFKCMK
jgi:hypothetical protein